MADGFVRAKGFGDGLRGCCAEPDISRDLIGVTARDNGEDWQITRFFVTQTFG